MHPAMSRRVCDDAVDHVPVSCKAGAIVWLVIRRGRVLMKLAAKAMMRSRYGLTHPTPPSRAGVYSRNSAARSGGPSIKSLVGMANSVPNALVRASRVDLAIALVSVIG